MVEFDVAKPWVLIIEDPSIRQPADELARRIEILRIESGVKQRPPLVLEAHAAHTLFSTHAPLVILRFGAGNGVGFSWRLERERLNIEGDSVRGLYNGVFDFLANLGFCWKAPSLEEVPRKDRNTGHAYILDEDHGYGNSTADVRAKRRLLFTMQSVKKWEEWIVWAARNRIDAVALPLAINPAGHLFGQIYKAAKKYDVAVEVGGWELSNLARHSLFLHKEMFRMTDGRRDKAVNFCPTAPETIKVLQKEAKKLFLRCQDVKVYHFWSDRIGQKGVSDVLRNGGINAWCSCPTCRAFTPDEQNRIAVNAVADVLLAIRPDARISFYEASSEKSDITLRPNLFKVSRLPETSGVEAGGWFLTT
ncbi:MAG: hypothetical protein LBF60_07810 [Treponema sp.]|jgi:hypothetical protein|nr:hypothetical protein [Treponema sp.]